MCHLSPQDQHVCQSHHGIAEAITGVLGRAQFPSCSFYHPRSSCSRFRPTRKAAICAGNFPDSNGIVMISKGKHVPIRLNQCRQNKPWILGHQAEDSREAPTPVYERDMDMESGEPPCAIDRAVSDAVCETAWLLPLSWYTWQHQGTENCP